MELLKAHRVDSDGLLPQTVFAVPGVNRFLGAFADLCKGYSLCALNDSQLYVGVSKRTDFIVTTTNLLTGEHKKFPLSSVKYKKEDKWGNYVKGVVSILCDKMQDFRGLTVTLDGSANFHDNNVFPSVVTLGLINSINELFQLGMSKKDIVAAAAAVFSSFCSESVPYLDIIALVYGEKGKFIFINMEQNSFSLLDNMFDASEYAFLLVDGNIPSNVMKEEFEFNTKTMSKTMAQFRSTFNRNGFKDFDEVGLKDRSEPLDEDERRICLYLLNEYKAAVSSAKLISQKDFVGFGKALNRIQRGIRDSLELTCPEIDWLLKRAGEMSCCLGAGIIFNGSANIVSVVIKRECKDIYISKLDEYEHIFGFRSSVTEFNPQNKISLIDLNNPALQN